MKTQLQGQQTQTHMAQGRNKRRKWLLLGIVFAGIFLLSLGIVWLLIQLGKIQQPWAGILTAIFPSISSISGLILNKDSREFFFDIFKKLEHNAPVEVDSSDKKGPSTLSSSLAEDEDVQVEIIYLPLQAPKVSSFNSVFLFNERLTGSEEFFGRKQERITLLERSRKASSTSIVGPRRIGKTWLIDYLIRVAPNQLGSGYRVGYLDATMPCCETVSGFIAAALESLGIGVSPQHAHLNLRILEMAVNKLKDQNLIPILCIDEFEGFNNQQEFDLDFFKGLRAISNEGLGLVVASKKTLLNIVGNNGHTSGFFNIFEMCILKPFSEKEAKAFVQAKGDQAMLSEQERNFLLECGKLSEDKQKWYPLRLQLAGKLLSEDKDDGVCSPNDMDYYRGFMARLEEKYQAVVEAG